MQHWLGRDARRRGPWLGAATALELLLVHALRCLARLARGPGQVPNRGRAPIQVRVVAGATAATLALGIAAAALVRAPAPPGEPVGGYAAEALASLGTPARDSTAIDAPAAAPAGGSSGGAGAAGTTLGAPDSPEAPSAPALPTGKGMWFHMLDQVGSAPDEIVAHARSVGLTHLYVRTGSSKTGFYARRDLDSILPAAHAVGLQVIGWDFPYLDDPLADAVRAVQAVAYVTPDGHRLDAFSADIETPSEGVNLGRAQVETYVEALRNAVGPDYPLIGTVPNACLNDSFPYAEVADAFDALAPMVYWITRDPSRDVACNVERLRGLGVPVLPVGQAYDPAIDNPTLTGLVPGYDDLTAFMQTAEAHDAAGVSFWAWHTATDEMWRAIADSGVGGSR